MNDFNPTESSTTEFSCQPSETMPKVENSKNSETTMDRCYRLIESLSDESKQQIRALADRRLMQLGVWDTTGSDLLHDAFLTILSGTQTGCGRHPSRRDIENTTTFAAYLTKVVNNFIAIQARKRMHQFIHEPIIDTDSQIEAESSIMQPGLDDYARFAELHDVLFCRLKSRYPIHFHATLDQWEQVCSSTGDIHLRRIHWRERVKFLALAKSVYNELGESLHDSHAICAKRGETNLRA